MFRAAMSYSPEATNCYTLGKQKLWLALCIPQGFSDDLLRRVTPITARRRAGGKEFPRP